MSCHLAPQRRSLFALVAAALALSCGGGTASEGATPPPVSVAPFIGEWSGTIVGSAGGAQRTSFVLVEVATGVLEVVGFCSDYTGPRAVAQDATHFTLQASGCPAVAEGACSVVRLVVLGGKGTLENGTLTLSFDTAVQRCSQSTPFTYTFTSGPAPSIPLPVARISYDVGVYLLPGTAVQLSGLASTDPEGDALTFAWTLLPPAGSQAQLGSSSGGKVSFTPDIAGAYSVGLVVSAGGRDSAPALAEITVSPVVVVPPAPVLSAPTSAALNYPVKVDASRSNEGSGGAQVTISWSLSGKPAGSTAALAVDSASALVVHFTPDLPGSYSVQLTLTNEDVSETATATIAAMPGVTTDLPFRPTLARYSRALDRLVLLSGAQLHIYDPAGLADQAIALPESALSVSMSSDGLFAVVGQLRHVSFIDLAGARLIASWPTQNEATQIVLGDPTPTPLGNTRYAFLFSAGREIDTLDLETGSTVFTYGWTDPDPFPVLQPATGNIFTTERQEPNGTGVVRFDVSGSGFGLGYLGETHANAYWSYAPMWISTDGSLLLTSPGVRFRAADLSAAGQVVLAAPGPIALAWADSAPDSAHWLVQPYTPTGLPSSDTSNDTGLLELEAASLSPDTSMPYPQFVNAGGAFPLHGRWVFYDSAGTHKIAVAQADNAANALQGFVVLRL